MSKLRESARNESCTIKFPGACNHNQETTVLAHLREFNEGGMGLKPHDLCAVYACHGCHDVLDRRVVSVEFEEERFWWIARALVATHKRMLEKGVLK